MAWYRRVRLNRSVYFFTVVTYRRRRFLTDDTSRRWLREAIETTRESHPFSIDAWVLLPDHLHCLWRLPDGDTDYSVRWALIKRRFTHRARTVFHREDWMSDSKRKHRECTIWQRRFYEHCIRDDCDYQAHLDYIHYNPVKHALVQRVTDWPWSSFHRWVARGTYSPDWATMAGDFEDGDFGE